MEFLDAGATVVQARERRRRSVDRRGDRRRRPSRDGKHQHLALSSDAALEPLQDGDVITVPQAMYVAVTGQVGKPGDTALTGGNTLIAAVYVAGGPLENGDVSHTELTHDGVRHVYDITKVPSGEPREPPPLGGKRVRADRQPRQLRRRVRYGRGHPLVLLNQPICIAGSGFVGIVSAVAFAELGATVSVYEPEQARIAEFDAGLPFHEPRVADLLRKHRTRGRVRFTSDLAVAIAGAGLVVICLETPAAADGSPDLSGVRRCVDGLAVCDLSACGAVVVRSTVPPGTSDEIRVTLGGSVPVIAAPEFLRKGTALADFLAPDRTIVGGDDVDALAGFAALFEPLGTPLMFTSARNAELIKAASNAFLAMKVTFANEIANLCDALGADAGEVLRGVGYDFRIGPDYLAPGIGFGGPSLEKDLRFLSNAAESRNVPFELARAVLDANREQPRRIVATAAAELGSLRGARIAVWGLAFKAGTDDVSSSQAVRVVEELVERGAIVSAFDPAVTGLALPAGATLAASPVAALKGAAALLVLTDWPEFAQIAPAAIAHALEGALVIDGRNLLDAERIPSAGLVIAASAASWRAGSDELPVANMTQFE